MNKLFSYTLSAFVSVTLVCLSGCGPTEPTTDADDGHGHDHHHDHGDGPKSFSGGMAELREAWSEITTAMESENLEAAHDPLHEVGHTLEALPDLAAETDLPEAEWNAVKSEVDKLFTAFGKIDAAFHQADGDKAGAYKAAKPTIDEGIAALEAKLAMLDDDPAEDVDEHNDDEHDHEDEEDGEDEPTDS